MPIKCHVRVRPRTQARCTWQPHQKKGASHPFENWDDMVWRAPARGERMRAAVAHPGGGNLTLLEQQGSLDAHPGAHQGSSKSDPNFGA